VRVRAFCLMAGRHGGARRCSSAAAWRWWHCCASLALTITSPRGQRCRSTRAAKPTTAAPRARWPTRATPLTSLTLLTSGITSMPSSARCVLHLASCAHALSASRHAPACARMGVAAHAAARTRNARTHSLHCASFAPSGRACVSRNAKCPCRPGAHCVLKLCCSVWHSAGCNAAVGRGCGGCGAGCVRTYA